MGLISGWIFRPDYFHRAMKNEEDNNESSEIVEFPINGVLDLHTFNPKDVKDLLPEYISACRKKGIFEIRVIHGKGTGALKKTVHSILNKLPGVLSIKTAGEDEGGWGATLVALKKEDNV